MLFALDAGRSEVEKVIADYWRESPGDAEGRPYADALVRNVHGDVSRLDERISAASNRWRIERMPRVDRNVLRIATWELLEELETPRAVILDEAVDLAKRFGTGESGAFVNGVLTRVADESGRPPDAPQGGEG